MWEFVFNMHSLFLGHEGDIGILCINVYSIFDHVEICCSITLNPNLCYVGSNQIFMSSLFAKLCTRHFVFSTLGHRIFINKAIPYGEKLSLISCVIIFKLKYDLFYIICHLLALSFMRLCYHYYPKMNL